MLHAPKANNSAAKAALIARLRWTVINEAVDWFYKQPLLSHPLAFKLHFWSPGPAMPHLLQLQQYAIVYSACSYFLMEAITRSQAIIKSFREHAPLMATNVPLLYRDHYQPAVL